jgi:RNA polymerase sigma factor (sigma-70 family)
MIAGPGVGRRAQAALIYAITLNAVRDHVRRRAPDAAFAQRARSDTGTDDAPDPLAQIEDSVSRNPEQAAIHSEMVACYLDYVRRLPRRYYVVYALSELEDLTNQESADRLSLSLGTVKIRLHRARALLHGELRRRCRCYRNERGELMGEPAPTAPASGSSAEAEHTRLDQRALPLLSRTFSRPAGSGP